MVGTTLSTDERALNLGVICKTFLNDAVRIVLRHIFRPRHSDQSQRDRIDSTSTQA